MTCPASRGSWGCVLPEDHGGVVHVHYNPLLVFEQTDDSCRELTVWTSACEIEDYDGVHPCGGCEHCSLWTTSWNWQCGTCLRVDGHKLTCPKNSVHIRKAFVNFSPFEVPFLPDSEGREQ